MHVRWIAASVFVATSSATLAQSPAVLGKDDAAYAAALMRFGYPDLAERLLGTVEKAGTLGPEEAINAKALHLDLRLEIAKRESDPVKRMDLLTAILEEKESLVGQYKGRQVAEDARNSLPDVYRLLGDAVTSAINRERDPEKIAAFQKRGAETYTKAEDSLRARIKELKEGSNTDSPEVQNQLAAALYNLPRTQYFHALLYPKEEFRRKDLLNQAIKAFQEYSLDFSDNLLNFEGLILEGLSHKELDELDLAKSAFKDAFSFPAANFEKDAKGFYPLSKEMADTVSEACLQWMNLLLEQKDPAGAIALAKEYMDTTPGALETRRGLAIVAAMADAYLALDDVKSANDWADKLVEADRGGAWGAKGREIQGRTMGGGKIDPSRALAIARSDADRGDDQLALQHAAMALEALKGKPEEQKLGPEVYLFVGGLFTRRGMDQEAALAFDTGSERFANADQAPEMVYQAIQRYIAINKDEKRPYYKKRIDERMKLLAAKYPNSDRAQGSITLEADQLMGEGRFLEAGDQYVKVLPSSRIYLEAQAKAGEAYLSHAVITLKDKPAEGKPFIDQAETIMKRVLAEVDKRLKETIDPGEQNRLQGIALRAITRLSELYLKTDRAQQVLTLLEGVDEKYGASGDALAYFWGFRIRAYEALDRIDDAVKLLDGLVKKDPQSKAIPVAAGIVARALDTKGQALRKAGKTADAGPMLKRAAQYYSMAGRAILAGGEGKVSEVEDIANRLFILALDINEVPADTSTFIGWDPKKTKDADLYQTAADLYESALRRSPNYKSRAILGKVYGFLGKWDKAATTFAELFDTEPLLDAKAKKINITLAQQKGELLPALFEWGVAENKVATAESDNDRFRRAQTIFETMRNRVYTPLSWWWWQAQYYTIRNMADMGQYAAAKFELNKLERESNDLGSKVGLAAAFAALKKELDAK
jgi:hypothetical protein